MAIITNKKTAEEVTLLPEHIFGRHANLSQTVLPQGDASRMHALILWDGEHWLLQDTSTNGTYLNGTAVNPKLLLTS